MKRRRYYYSWGLLICNFLLNGCTEREEIDLHLNQAKTDIYYSDFVELGATEDDYNLHLQLLHIK